MRICYTPLRKPAKYPHHISPQTRNTCHACTCYVSTWTWCLIIFTKIDGPPCLSCRRFAMNLRCSVLKSPQPSNSCLHVHTLFQAACRIRGRYFGSVFLAGSAVNADRKSITCSGNKTSRLYISPNHCDKDVQKKKPPFFTVFDHAVTRLSLAHRRVARGRRLVDVTKTLWCWGDIVLWIVECDV